MWQAYDWDKCECGVRLFDKASNVPERLLWYEHVNCNGRCPVCASGKAYPEAVMIWLVSSGQMTAVQVGRMIAARPEQSTPRIDMLLQKADTFENRQRIRARRRILEAGVTPSGIPLWSNEEKQFIRDNWGRLSRKQIAKKLGRRSATAVTIWAKRHGLGAAINLDGQLSSGKVRKILGKNDTRSITRMMKQGVMPGYQVSGVDRSYMAVDAHQFKRWLVNWRNWIYFDVEAMPLSTYKRLVLLAQARWKDAWWTTGQVADYHHLASSNAVCNQIYAGKLPASRWQNWMVLRSDAMGAAFRYADDDRLDWSPHGDEYLALAAAIGVPFAHIAANMGWGDEGKGESRVRYRLQCLLEDGDLPTSVQYRDGIVFADWRNYAGRFPGLARAITAFVEGRPLTETGTSHVRYVLKQWAMWYAPGSDVARSLNASALLPETLRDKWMQLCKMGFDPLGKNQLNSIMIVTGCGCPAGKGNAENPAIMVQSKQMFF